MNKGLNCDLCNQSFKFHFAKEFHFDVEHIISSYMCDICEDSNDKYLYFELIHHVLNFYNSNSLSRLDYLISFLSYNPHCPLYTFYPSDAPTT